MAKSKCVGIDLGTTNSVIAMMADDNKTIVCRTDRAGRKTFPSVIVYDQRKKTILAGQRAFNRRGLVPEPIVSVKSHMGDANYRATTGPLTMSPVEVSAEVLKAMKEQMEEYLHGMPEYADYVVDRAVITIPAYFASNAREATTKAGELAGLKVEFTLQEPTAAALYYCFKNGIDNGIFMVYDLGGGTFDVSIVKLDEGDAYVLGIAGNNYLGGDNFDDALAHHLLDELIDSDEGYELEDMDINGDEEDKRRFTRLKLSAEVIKKALSSQEEYFESSDGIFEDKIGAKVNLAASVTVEEFEDLIRPMLESTLDECHKALREAEDQYGVTLDMIDGVLLVGGSTHIPLVGKIIEENFTNPSLPSHTKMPKPLIDEPDMAVGYGAAIAAASTGHVTGGNVTVGGGKTISVTASFGPAVGFGGVSMVEGRLNAEDGNLPDDVYAKVSRVSGGFNREYMLEEDGSFVFEDLEYDADSEPYTCQFISGGKVILEAGFDAVPSGGGEIPVVLSRNYYIETLDELTGAIKKVLLMKKGTQLPCSQDFRFTTNSTNPYFVRLRFFEEKEFLKQLQINFPKAVAPGTEINLALAFDRSSRFTVRAESAGVVVESVVEPAPAPELPTPDEVDKAVSNARERVALIPEPGKKVVAETQLNRLVKSLNNAIDAGDAYQAKEILNTIRGLGRGAGIESAPVGLSPSREDFERKVSALQQQNRESEKGSDDIAKEISRTATQGYRAYDNEDQAALTKACEELDQIREMIEDTTPPEKPPMWMVCAYFSQQILDVISKYQQDRTLPPAARKQFDRYVRDDIRSCQDIQSGCRLMPEEKDCAPYLQIIREMYPRWDQCSKLMNDTGLPGMP